MPEVQESVLEHAAPEAQVKRSIMTSDDILSAAREVINGLRQRTKHAPTAERILNAAREGFSPGFTDYSTAVRDYLANSGCHSEGLVVPQESQREIL